MKELEIPYIGELTDYENPRSMKIASSADLGKFMPVELGMALEKLNKSIIDMSLELDDGRNFVSEHVFKDYLTGLSYIKQSIYRIKDSRSGYVRYYSLLIERLVELDERFQKYDCITCVPSSDPNKISGLESILSHLNDDTEKDCFPLLFRTRYKEPKHMTEGEDDTYLQNDLEIQSEKKYNGIIIIDDVVTSGKTLEHCALLLESISRLPVIKLALTETVNLSYHEPRAKKGLFEKFRDYSTESSLIGGNPRNQIVNSYLISHFLHATSLFVYKALKINQHAFRRNKIRIIIDPDKEKFMKIHNNYIEELFPRLGK